MGFKQWIQKFLWYKQPSKINITAIDPIANISKKVPAFPYDENGKPACVPMVAIVDPVTHEIKGYLPVATVDNGDGTASIKTVS
jgi:hypothetical protein